MKYFLVAGEASGDLHGGHLVSALRRRDPHATFTFLGGDRMEHAAGTAPLVHFSSMAFMGFVSVLRNLGTIRRITTITQSTLLSLRPDKLILIDYPGFNLRLARWVKHHLPDTEVIYYISPKLWAWKSYRIRSIRRYVDRMFTIFPFETEWYAARGYHVTYVGNPTVDSVSAYLAAHPTPAPIPHLPADRPIIALLPGSRRQEISRCLPRMAALAPLFPAYRFVVAAAPGADPDLYRCIAGTDITLVSASTYDLLHLATAAIVNSGTATLETALFHVPQIVVYDVIGGPLARLLKRIVLKIPHVSLVNIIARRPVVTELIADRFTTPAMAHHLHLLLSDDTISAEIRKNYLLIAENLGAPGAAERCAQMILT